MLKTTIAQKISILASRLLKILYKTEKLNYFYALLIYFGFGLLVCVNYSKNSFIIGIDTILPLDKNSVNEFFTIWPIKAAFFGPDIFKIVEIFPYAYLVMLFYKLNLLTQQHSQFLVNYLLFSLSGFSAYYLVKQIYTKIRFKFLILAGLVYMFNFYNLFLLSAMPYFLLLSYSAFPFCLGLLTKLLKMENSNKSSAHAIFYSAVCYFLLVASYATPPYFLIHLFFFVFVFLISHLIQPSKLNLKIFTIFISSFIVFNLSWILPIVVIPKSSLYGLISEGGNSFDTYRSNSARMQDAIRFTGYFGLESKYKNHSFYEWYKFYKNPILVVITLLIPITAFIGVFNNKKNYTNDRKYYLLFTSSAIFMIMLISIAYSPFAFFFNKILHPTGFFDLFRTAYQRFSAFLILTYTILIPYSFDVIDSKYANNIKKQIAYISFILLLIVNIFPLLNKSIYDKNGIIPSKKIVFPQEYYQITEYLKESSDDVSNSLVLPINNLGLYSLDWNNGENGYDGVHPFSHFGVNNLIYFGKENNNLLNEIMSNKELSFGVFNSLLDIKTIILHTDLNIRFTQNNSTYGKYSPTELESRLNEDPCFKKAKDFEYVKIYLINEECSTNKTFLTNSIVDIRDSNTSSMPKIANYYKLLNSGLIFVDKSNSYNSQVNTDGHIVIPSILTNLFPNKNYWYGNWKWPDVRVSPNNPIYTFVKVKEQVENLALSGTKYESIDNQVWLIAKRAQEINTYKLTQKDNQQFYNHLQQKITEINSLYNSNDNSGSYYDSLLKTIQYLRKTNNLINDEKTNIIIESTIDKLVKRFDTTFAECKKQCYTIYNQKNKKLKLDIFGDKSFDKLIKLSIDDKTYNIANDTTTEVTIENDKAKATIDFDANKLPLSKVRIEDTGTNYGFLNEQPVVKIPYKVKISNWEPNTNYKINFEYKASGAKLYLDLFELSEDYSKFTSKEDIFRSKKENNSINERVTVKNLLNNISLFDSSSFTNMQLKVRSSNNIVDKTELVFNVSPIYKNLEYNVEIKNIEVSKINDIYPVLSNNLPNITDNLELTPIKLEKINPFTYRLSTEKIINEKKYLVFKEKFDKGWNLYSGVSSTRSILYKINSIFNPFQINFDASKLINSNHFEVNLTSNAWEIEPEQINNKYLYIAYTPQIYLIISYVMYLIYFTAVLSSLIYLVINNKWRKK